MTLPLTEAVELHLVAGVAAQQAEGGGLVIQHLDLDDIRKAHDTCIQRPEPVVANRLASMATRPRTRKNFLPNFICYSFELKVGRR